MIHEGHDRSYIAVSKTDDRIKLWCCDNCGRHHWGIYTGGYWSGVDYMDVDFDYLQPSGDPYLCPEGHALYGGPDYCFGECWACWRERRAAS